MVWVPTRCEAPGCTGREGLMACQGCSLVMYCCAQCQKVRAHTSSASGCFFAPVSCHLGCWQ